MLEGDQPFPPDRDAQAEHAPDPRAAWGRCKVIYGVRPRPLLPVPDGPLPRRRRPHGPLQLALRAARGRPLPAAQRGHRPGPQRGALARGDPRRPALARPGVGRGDRPPVRAPRRPRRRRDEADRGRPRLLVRLHEGGDRGAEGARRRLRRLLPRPRPRARRGPRRPLPRPRRGLDDGRRHRPRRGDVRERDDRRLRHRPPRRRADVRAGQRGRRRLPAASPTSSAARSTSRRRRSTCCSATRWAWARTRSSPTSRCSSTRSARSSPSAATRSQLLQFRDEGYVAEAMRNYLALLGWNAARRRGDHDGREDDRPVPPRGRLARARVLRRVQKLQHFNAHYIREMPEAEFAEAARPFIERDRRALRPASSSRQVAPLAQTRVKTLAEVPDLLGVPLHRATSRSTSRRGRRRSSRTSGAATSCATPRRSTRRRELGGRAAEGR